MGKEKTAEKKKISIKKEVQANSNQPETKSAVKSSFFEYGITLTLDNSLKKFANERFILEHAERAERKFAKNKTAL